MDDLNKEIKIDPYKAVRIRWNIWLISVVFVATGMFGLYLFGQYKETDIILTENAENSITLVRLYPEQLRFEIEIPRNNLDGTTRLAKIGNYTHNGDFKKSGVLYFENPGASIKISAKIKGSGTEKIYEAKPASSSSAAGFGRLMVPFVDDGDPKSFLWPPPKETFLHLPAGITRVHFSVVEVGSILSGEKVKIQVNPPIAFKGHQKGYGFLWWFFLWPIFVGILVLYALNLLWMTYWIRKNMRLRLRILNALVARCGYTNWQCVGLE